MNNHHKVKTINLNSLSLSLSLSLTNTHTKGWVQITLSNVTLLNNLLLNSYFEKHTIELHVLYVFNVHTNLSTNQILLIIRSINSSFIYYYKLQKLEFKQLVDDMAIDVWSSWNFLSIENIWRWCNQMVDLSNFTFN